MRYLLANLEIPLFAVIDFALDKPFSAAATASALGGLIAIFLVFR
jgi:hypothetical protein